MKKASISILMSILLATFVASTSYVHSAENIHREQAIQKGMDWLTGRTTGGGWETYSVVYGNALAIRAYAATGNQSSAKFSLLLSRLKELQSPDGSWDENVTSTACAVCALIEAGEATDSLIIQNAVSWLKAKSDFSDASEGNTTIVSLTLITLIRAGEPITSKPVFDGLNWLKANQNPDGFWGVGAGDASVDSTGDAVIALILAESASSPKVQKAVGYLRTHYAQTGNPDSSIKGLETFLYANDTSAIQIGQAKVLSFQNGDYGWSSFPNMPSHNAMTAKAAFTLARSGYSAEPLDKAMLWIENHISETGDYSGDYVVVAPTAWAILGLSTVENDSIIQQATDLLVNSQQGGWGWWSVYHPEVIGSEVDNTGLCVWSLYGSGRSVSSAIQQAAAAIISGQNEDGGWGLHWTHPPEESMVTSTNSALITLLCAGYDTSNSSLVRGLEYLVNNSEDNHWSSTGQTAMSAIIFKKAAYDDQLLSNTIQWLIQNQNEDGGWGSVKGEKSTVASTALTMIALNEYGTTGTVVSGASVPGAPAPDAPAPGTPVPGMPVPGAAVPGAAVPGAAVTRGAAWLMAAQNADGGWGDRPEIYSSNTGSTAQAVWALAAVVQDTLDITLDQENYCPGDTVNIEISTNSTHICGSITNPSGEVIPLDSVPGGNPDRPSYQATLDTNAVAGTYILAVGTDDPAGCGAASFAVYPLHSFYQDNDADGYGNPNLSLAGCQIPEGYVLNTEDGNDRDPDINPGAAEICDGQDNDCDGEIDEGFSFHTCFADSDGDGYGDPEVSVETCSCPTGYVEDHTDCDDTDENVHPGATEIPDNTKDDDCLGGDESSEYVTHASGEINIEGTVGRIGDEIRIAVRIQDPSDAISAFGFNLVYDPGVMEYEGLERGDLVDNFTLFNVNDIGSGRLRVGGATYYEHNIPEGASGCLLWLKFRVTGGLEGESYPIQLEELKDHIADFSKSAGCLYIICKEDINGDKTIDLDDATIVFNCYLGAGPCSDFADVNKDGEVTPIDALYIFQKYHGTLD